MQRLEELIHEAEQQLIVLEKELAELVARAEAAGTMVEEEMKAQQANIKKHQKKIREHLILLREEGMKVWQDVEAQLEKARRTIEERLDKAQAKFK